MIINPAGDSLVAEGCGTHTVIPMYFSVGVSSTHCTHTMKAFCLNIDEIFPGLKYSQFWRCAELCCQLRELLG